MAWTTPVTWLISQLVNASDLNAQIRDNMNVLATAITTASGKITALNSTCFASLDGSNLTGIGVLANTNVWTAKNTFSGAGRLVVPVGVGKWAT